MAYTIRDGSANNKWAIGATSLAGRVTPYDSRGINQGKLRSYSAGSAKFAVASTSVKVFSVLQCSATTTIRLQRVSVSLTCATAAIYPDIQLIKNSTLTSGGTKTDLTKVPYVSTSAAATPALCSVYTVEPTEGTLLGVVAARQVFAPITGTPATGVSTTVFDFSVAGQLEAPALTAGGTTEFALRIATAYSNQVTAVVTWEWTEE